MKKKHILHLIIGLSAAVLALVAIYYIYLNPKNLISAGIIATAGVVIAISQYLIIKRG
ncbi:putative membrane protein [Pedobacter sp. UYP30]|uniref:hypothetical protein n=1 Tax=Pedobacter sp. UYP30 TaxID=1756400 RepID=UPI003398549F